MPRLRQARDIVCQPFYDTVRLGTTTAGASFILFQTPKGTGTSPVTNSGAKTEIDTNMVVAGQLPAPWGFVTRAISIQFDPSVTVADLVSYQTFLWGKFTVGAKDWLTAPAT